MPRLLFGSTKDSGESNLAVLNGFHGSKCESLRWKYHAAHDDAGRKKQPKVTMDVSVIPVAASSAFTDPVNPCVATKDK